MLVEAGHQPLAETAHDTGGLDSVLVILEALLWREAGHAHVVPGFAIALRIAQIDDIYRMMASRPARLLRRRRRHRGTEVRRSTPAPATIEARGPLARAPGCPRRRWRRADP